MKLILGPEKLADVFAARATSPLASLKKFGRLTPLALKRFRAEKDARR